MHCISQGHAGHLCAGDYTFNLVPIHRLVSRVEQIKVMAVCPTTTKRVPDCKTSRVVHLISIIV